MKRVALALFALSLLFSLSQPLAAQSNREISFNEDFALAADREAALQLLIPGTEEYYFYHCLHQQHLGNLDEVDRLMTAWAQRHTNESARRREMRYRQALLRYDDNAEQTLAFLRRELNLHFNHQRERLDQRPDYPTTLDQGTISRNTLIRRALSDQRRILDAEPSAADWLIDQDLSPLQRRQLLQNLARPDYPNLPQLIMQDLRYEGSRGFGSLNIHNLLLKDQLDLLARLEPTLLRNNAYVNAYLLRLQPPADDAVDDPQVRLAHLERMWQFVSTLEPVFNSLKTHVLYQRLMFDRSRGVYDRDLFMQYLRLPRQVGYINPRYMERQEHRQHAANLREDFRQQTLLPPIVHDEELVRSYLLHFLRDAAGYDAFGPYIQENYLKQVFAEAKIVNGIGNMEDWFALMPPAQYQALRDRVDIDFAFDNPDRFGVDEPVKLDVYAKNVETLLVKVFRINNLNYYRATGQGVNTDIELDGLVANHEMTFHYDESPLRRIRRTFELDMIDQRGTYVVEFIGNGVSSRALIRKGELRHLVQTTAAGHMFIVLDEANQPLTDASIYLDQRQFHPDEQGRIFLPFSNDPGIRRIMLVHGDFAQLDQFQHQSEQYDWQVSFHVDREQLLPRKQARLLMRVQLDVSGRPAPIEMLEQLQLTIATTDHDGITSTQTSSGVTLNADGEAVHPFTVPQRLHEIRFTLEAKVKNMSQGGQMQSLAATDQRQINVIDHTQQVADAHLSRDGGRYALDVLGKTGEVRADQPIQLQIKHRDFSRPVTTTLKTDEAGRIDLGQLRDIQWVRANSPTLQAKQWHLAEDAALYPQRMHLAAGQTVRLPYLGAAQQPNPRELSLLEHRGNVFYADRFDRLAIRDGYIVIDNLQPGDYDLLIKPQQQTVRIHVVAGDALADYVLGDARHAQVSPRQLAQITAIRVDDDQVHIHLAGATGASRVHVVATGMTPAFDLYHGLAQPGMPTPLMRHVRPTRSFYVAGRNIGDEYRYILERRAGDPHPGNMLDRPELLLNPWAIRKTETEIQEARAGEAPRATPDAQMPGMVAEREEDATRRRQADRDRRVIATDTANLDFFTETSIVAANLVPDENGVIQLDRELLGDRHHIHVLLVDPTTTVYRQLPLPQTDAALNDLRLARHLDPDEHFTQQRRVSIVNSGDTFTLDNAVDSEFEIYDSLAKVYRLYATLNSELEHLSAFRFILDWPTLDDDAKREKYTEYASHELNFFIAQKDPQFFEDVVRPHLVNKMHRTFMDDYLLGEDLAGYLDPYAFNRLNIVERALLIRRLAEQREQLARHLRDLNDLLPPDLPRDYFLFDTALKGSALDEAGVIAEQLKELGDRMDDAARDGRAGVGRGGLFGQAQPRAAAPAAREAADAAPAFELESRRVRPDADSAEGRLLAPGDFERLAQRRSEMQQFYEVLDKTMEWVENNYYKLPLSDQNETLVPINGFWRDYAAYVAANDGDDAGFLSAKLAYAHHNLTDILLALAVLDLPFDAAEHDMQLDQGVLTIAAGSPLIVFHKEIRPAQPAEDVTPILLSQNFYRADDRYRHVDNERLDKFITDEFIINVVYGCQVAITNPTSSTQRLDVLLQIPHGALPVNRSKATNTVHVSLEPFQTQTLNYFFYFPAAGQMPHYPAHAARHEQLVAFVEPFTFNVVEQATQIDTDSWEYISQHGSEEQVIDYMAQHNLGRIDLGKIAWRMRDAAFFNRTLDLLRSRRVYHDVLWSYGIHHNDLPALREYLRHAEGFLQRCGAYLESTLVTIDPVERWWHEHMEYSPLVNARAHSLGQRRQILNNRFREQYERLMNVLSYRPTLDDEDRMAATYYLLLQDRVAQAKAMFEQVDRQQLVTRMQYDYFAAYLDFFNDEPTLAREIAQRYADYPVDRWRHRFRTVLAQLDELEGRVPDMVDERSREQRQAQRAAAESNFEFVIDAAQVKLSYQNVAQIEVHYYLMDIELLFSRQPFVQEYTDQFTYVQPNLVQRYELPDDATQFTFDLPEQFGNRNVMVQVLADGKSQSQPYFSNMLSVQVLENAGQLRVTRRDNDQPQPRVYVKVFARMKDDSVRFYKDGYTDLRGRFDYTSLSTDQLDNVQRFSILILSEDHGAVVREAAPPRR